MSRMSRISDVIKKEKATPDEVFFLLEPESMDEFAYRENYRLRSSYKISRNNIDNFDEFKKEVAKYFYYHMTFGKKSLGNSDLETVATLAENVLGSYYNNLYIAFDRQKAGIDGGMMGIYDKLCEHFIKEHRGNYITYISNIFKKYEKDFILSFFEKYYQKYGQYLEHRDTGHYLWNLDSFIRNHFEMVLKSR